MRKELQKATIIVLLLSLTSCATLFSNKTYKLQVKSVDNSKVRINDSIYNLPAKIEVERSKKELPVVLILSDTLQKEYVLKSSIRPVFWYGNTLFLSAGYLIDLTNKNRFYYGNSVFLNADGTITKSKSSFSKTYSNLKDNLDDYFSKEYRTRKGQINLIISMPWVNNFDFKPNDEQHINNTGFFGFSAGIEYYHNKNRFLSLNASGVMNFVAPFPAPFHYEGEHEFLSSTSINLSENYKINRFTFGYGLNFSKNKWKLENTDYDSTNPESEKPRQKANYGLGLIGTTYFQCSEKFFIGLNYKPTFYNFNPSSKFQYEHVISLDLLWKIRLKK